MSTVSYPVTCDIEYPERLSRLLIFVKSWLFVIPHVIVLALLGFVYLASLAIAFLAILIAGRYPRPLFNLAVGFLRWQFRVNVYAYLMRDEYPPFSLTADYPARLEVAYPERLSRWKVFVKWLLAVPHLIILYGYGYLVQAITFLAWFTILFTGRYPRGLFNLAASYWRWMMRTYAYVLLLTDEYPPFSNA